jgi:large subunit ribosomal protein L2
VAIKKFRPTTASRRYMTAVSGDDLTDKRPERRLVVRKKTRAGRDNRGQISARRRGGGHRRLIRQVDFKRDKDGVAAKVVAIEYDPNRSARLALLHYRDGDKRYILAPAGIKIGATLMSGEQADIRVGNALPISAIPVGAQIHNVELSPGRGGQICRGAGASAQLIAKEGKFATLRLPSGEMRMVYVGCRATIGQVGNVDHSNITLGKAGRLRWMGRRPQVRGKVMSPRDHPHGGGEGRNPVGRKTPMSRWGKPTLGVKTRRRHKPSDGLIVRHRRRKR